MVYNLYPTVFAFYCWEMTTDVCDSTEVKNREGQVNNARADVTNFEISR
jgi:hypothetical protein